MTDNRFTPDGWQYGVRFADGSVMTRWCGRTQEARAREARDAYVARQVAWLAAAGVDRQPDVLVVVRRRLGGQWLDHT